MYLGSVCFRWKLQKYNWRNWRSWSYRVEEVGTRGRELHHRTVWSPPSPCRRSQPQAHTGCLCTTEVGACLVMVSVSSVCQWPKMKMYSRMYNSFFRWNTENICRQFKTKYSIQDNPAVYNRSRRLCCSRVFGEVWSGKGEPQGLLHCPGT